MFQCTMEFIFTELKYQENMLTEKKKSLKLFQ